MKCLLWTELTRSQLSSPRWPIVLSATLWIEQDKESLFSLVEVCENNLLQGSCIKNNGTTGSLCLSLSVCGLISALTFDFWLLIALSALIDDITVAGLEVHTIFFFFTSCSVDDIHYRTKCVWSMILVLPHYCRITCASIGKGGCAQSLSPSTPLIHRMM